MSIASEIQWTCLRELRRNLRSAKGIIMAVLVLLSGAAASLIYTAITRKVTERLAQGGDVPMEAFRQSREQLWETTTIAHYLANSPLFLVGLFKVLWWLLPFLTLMIGFDQVCGDLQYRTIRYDIVRSRRWTIITGKALAVWAILSSVVLALNLFVWIVVVARGDEGIGVTLSWGGRFWLLEVVYIAAWSGITILVSSLTRRPILSLLMGMAVVAGLTLGDLITYALKGASSDWWISKLAPARFAFPGFYQEWVITPKAPEMVGAIAILLAFGAATTAAACWLVDRSDV
jgi:ABC-type transport system involved in multi-copper enzyme maturation permease subunit